MVYFFSEKEAKDFLEENQLFETHTVEAVEGVKALVIFLVITKEEKREATREEEEFRKWPRRRN